MSAPVPSAIGKAGEGRRISGQVASDKLKNDAVVQQPTGFDTATNESGNARSYFDSAPHAVHVDANDEAMRDLVSLAVSGRRANGDAPLYTLIAAALRFSSFSLTSAKIS